MYRLWLHHDRGTTLTFTAAGLRHGDRDVCELAAVRGLRLFVYPVAIQYLADVPLPRTDSPPATNRPLLPPEFAPIPPGERPPDRTEAALSLVIGDEGRTHGLFGGFDPAALRTLADDIHRRLTAFRYNCGLTTPPDALGVVETTAEAVEELMHTLPPTGVRGRFVVGLLVLTNRWVGVLWCAAMFAGLVASGRLIVAAGLNPALLAWHGLLGFIHLALLFFHLQGRTALAGTAPKPD